MKEPTKLEKLIDFITDIPLKTKQAFCRHEFNINLSRPVKDGWDICNGGMHCKKCFLYANYHADLIDTDF